MLDYSRNIKLLTEHHLEFLGLKGGCIGLSVSTLVKIPNCSKSHVTVHIIFKVKLRAQILAEMNAFLQKRHDEDETLKNEMEAIGDMLNK